MAWSPRIRTIPNASTSPNSFSNVDFTASTSVVGSVYQMLNHGISTGALFFMVGMLYERRHTRLIADFGGIRSVMPWFAALFLMIALSSIAVPGWGGFVGESA